MEEIHLLISRLDKRDEHLLEVQIQEEETDKTSLGMIMYNQIPGIVPFRHEDGKYLYEIPENFAPIAQSEGELSHKEFKLILSEVNQVLHSCMSFLIKGVQMILDEEYIYWDREQCSVYFLCIPVICNFNQKQLFMRFIHQLLERTRGVMSSSEEQIRRMIAEAGSFDEELVLNISGAVMTQELTILHERTGKSLLVKKTPFVIGKSKINTDYCVEENSAVSRRHMGITACPDGYYVTDYESSNFTFVNEKKIAGNEAVRLQDGDRIKLANEYFTVKIA